MANADLKIPFSFCRIKRAAEFLNMHTSDLLSLAVAEKISLCVRLNGLDSILSLGGNVNDLEEWYLSLSYDNSVLARARNISTYTSFSIDNMSSNDNLEPVFHPLFYKARYGDDSFDENWSHSHRGRAYGLWIPPSRTINSILSDGKVYTGGQALGFYKTNENSPDGVLFPLTKNEAVERDSEKDDDNNEGDDNYEEIYEKFELTESDLWITANTVRRLIDFNGDYFNLEHCDSGVSDDSKINFKHGDSIHHSAERHAGNREQVLMAALRLREQQNNVFEECCRKPNGDINFSAWARELINRPNFFINQNSPIKTEAKIAEILSNAHKSPGERKT